MINLSDFGKVFLFNQLNILLAMNAFQSNPDLFLQLIGKSIQDKLFQDFQTEFTSPSTQKLPNGQLYLYKEDGIAVKIVKDQINSIKFYLSPNPICNVYQGQNVFELKRITDETQIRKNDFYERVVNTDPNRLTNNYKRDSCLFSFDSMTGEFLLIEILNEFV